MAQNRKTTPAQKFVQDSDRMNTTVPSVATPTARSLIKMQRAPIGGAYRENQREGAANVVETLGADANEGQK